MRIKYDLHVHSALSPCADNDMTPVNVVAYAKLNGIDMVAIADHNAIFNVRVALEAGKAFGVTVVPAIEVQTEEDVHVLCLFKNYNNLESFYKELDFPKIKNKPEIFGEQLIIDEDDNVTAEYDDLLLVSARISSATLPALAGKHGGIAIPAHIDRDANGMVQILGGIDDGYKVVELSLKASDREIEEYGKKYTVIIDSDAHTLESIGKNSIIELKENSIDALFDYLCGE